MWDFNSFEFKSFKRHKDEHVNSQYNENGVKETDKMDEYINLDWNIKTECSEFKENESKHWPTI